MNRFIHKNGFGSLVKYFRKKNKVSQATLGAVVGLDHTMISRIENGKVIPSKTVAETISVFLKLSADDVNELMEAFAQSILEREGLSAHQIFLKDNEAFQIAKSFVSDARDLRLKGMPKLAVAESEQKISLLYTLHSRAKKESTKKEILFFLGQLLMEVSKSYMDYLLPQDVWTFMTPLIERQKIIGQETGNPTLMMMSKMSEESALYVSKNYHKAHQIGDQLYSNLNVLDENWHSEVIRASAINAGYLNNQSEVKKLGHDVKFYLQSNSSVDHMNSSFVLEGLARAQGDVNDKNVMRTIDKAWEYIEKGKKAGTHSALRTVQLIRTQLRVMNKIGDDGPNDFERIGYKGLILAEELGYTRYEKEIQKLMDSTL